MDETNRKKMLFVYNPHSGRGEITQSLSDILWRFTSYGYDVTVHPTLAHAEGQEFIGMHAGEYDIVVTGGGDGMLHELFVGILENESEVPCGYIPYGTVNDFASSLMISKNPIEAAETIVNGKITEIDAGIFNGKVFSYVAAFGLFTKASYSTDQTLKNLFGFGAYLLEIIKTTDLIHFSDMSVHARVLVGDREYEDDFIFGFAGNTLSVGGLTNIVPSTARMNDGLLELVFIKTPKSLQDLDLIRQAFMNHDLNSPSILSLQADRVKVHMDRETEWTLDGEYGGKYTEVNIGIKSRAVKVLCP
ncbi:MAG: YegS/Rv2252/BmrU family lipid kinase [Lachnospiraceae bacterium]|nr:YegS/Rv2252/BmrU family lipid kinase [Lachnospiraceae bacterium]